MHTVPQTTLNPFALMLDPKSVIDAMDHSDRLARLHRQVYRPLDRPSASILVSDSVKAYDEAIDYEAGLDRV